MTPILRDVSKTPILGRMRSRNRIRPSIIAFTFSGLLGTMLVSPRFSINVPSLVDDWAAIARSPAQIENLSSLATRDSQRFRPGWIVWNYLQWHTLGAPAHMFSPNVWGIGRLLVLAAGLAALTALVLRSAPDSIAPPARFALIVLPGLIVLTVPQFAVDLARFGPQEPLLIGGMALGASLLVLACRELLDTSHAIRKWRLTAEALPGYILWVVGAYQKEVSVCVLAAGPFIVAAGWQTWVRQVHPLAARRRLLLASAALLVLLPLLHVAIEVFRIASAGPLVYGAEVSPGPQGIHRLLDAVRNMTQSTGSLVGLLLLATLPAVIGACVVRRRPMMLEAGLVACGITALVWSSQAAVFPSRYYMPTVALLAVALASFVARLRLPRRVCLVAAAMLVAIVAASSVSSYRAVRDWSADERQSALLVRTVAQLHSTGCPIFASGLDPERRQALPVLVRLQRVAHSRCVGPEAFIVRGSGQGASALFNVCAGAETEIGRWRLNDLSVVVLRCDAVAAGGRAPVEARRLL